MYSNNSGVRDDFILPSGTDNPPGKIIHSARELSEYARQTTERHKFVKKWKIGRSVLGKPIHAFEIGWGRESLLLNAAHHANEYITASLLTGFLTEYAEAVALGGKIGGIRARELFFSTKMFFVPLVNPDGVELVTGALRPGAHFDSARAIAARYPEIPFPRGWKANIRGVDLNLQYPAGWERAREIKGAAGFDGPSPRDWPGEAPLSEPESRALYDYTRKIKPRLTLSFHTQGEVIYWKYADREPPRSRELAERLARVSGYEMEETPYSSGFAGYKDWYISEYDLPGYTIEAGLGEFPLPENQFGEMYDACRAIICEAARRVK